MLVHRSFHTFPVIAWARLLDDHQSVKSSGEVVRLLQKSSYNDLTLCGAALLSLPVMHQDVLISLPVMHQEPTHIYFRLDCSKYSPSPKL